MNFITIGTFDGVHKGHQKLFDVLKKYAHQHKAKTLLLYFSMPPKAVNKNKMCENIMLPNEKMELLKTFGINTVQKIYYEQVRDITQSNFFNILIKKYKMSGLICGQDFQFGKNKKGNTTLLKTMCKEHNIFFKSLPFYKLQNKKVSSSRIRDLIKHGEVKMAKKLLGRHYSLTGKVIVGNQLGRTIGFPTANLITNKDKITPLGIFAGYTTIQNKKYNSVINIGYRPTVNTIKTPLLESHIINFKKNIYGKKIKVELVDKIRDEKKFENINKLKEQLKLDTKTSILLLSKTK